MEAKEREYQELMSQYAGAIERFVYYKIPIREEAEDILQEISIKAYRNFHLLKDKEAFKGWMLKIAANACNDYYRKVFRSNNVSLEEQEEIFNQETQGSWRVRNNLQEAVDGTLEALPEAQGLLLKYYYYEQRPIAEIARKLGIPEGTVKSRLNKARMNFKENYPYRKELEGENEMKQGIMPEISPQITIEKLEEEVFEVRCAQDISSYITPRVGEKTTVAAYFYSTYPEMKKEREDTYSVEGKANIHGLSCVEIKAQFKYNSHYHYVRETEDYVQCLAGWMNNEEGEKKLTTFLDDGFWEFWGNGKDNCGDKILKQRTGEIQVREDGSLYKEVIEVHNQDVVGRYKVTIGENVYDTIRLVYFNEYDELVEDYISKEGKVVLFRRFNKYNYDVGEGKTYDRPWTEMLPDTDRIILNGEIYVHWFNSLPDYVVNAK